MARVFVSFATPDLPVAREIVGWLRGDGHEVFLDRDAVNGIRAGEQWRRRLYDELRRVDAVISVVTPASTGSAWCAAELGIADALGCLLIPLRAADEACHPLLEHRQYADYRIDPQAARARVLDALRHLDGGLTGPGWRDGANPFPGLEPFPPSSAAVYFGRSAEVRELANRLRAARSRPGTVLVVVGSSGCGKSSLLNAGLLPLLDQDAEWLTASPWKPGDDPLSALTRSLTHTAQRCGLQWFPHGIHRVLAADPGGLRRVVTDLLGARPTAHERDLLVAVDQGEELFTRTSVTRRSYVAAMLRDVARGPTQPVITLRSEFLDDLRDLPGLEGAPIDVLVLPPLTRDMLPAVIEGPARVAGLRLEPELVPRLVNDTGSGDALPLLAFTLRQLSDGLGRGDTLTLARYAALGGVQGALSQHADAALAEAVATTGLTEQEVLAGLVRLVSIDDAGRWSRRQVAAAGLPERVRAAVQVLVERRLVVVDAVNGVDMVGVVHEALLTAWPPLRRAIGERLAALQAARTVEQAAADWQRDGCQTHYLWDDKRLAGARANLGLLDGNEQDDLPVHLDPAAQAFLEASARRVQAVQRQAQRRRRGLVTMLSVLLVLALTAAGTAVLQTWKAQQGQRLASARALLAQADDERERDPRAALQLAAAAYTLDPSPSAQASVTQTLARTPALRRTLGGYASDISTFSADGRVLVAVSDGAIVLRDVGEPDRPGSVSAPFRGSGQQIDLFAITPDAHRLAAMERGGPLTLWDMTDREHPRAAGPPLDLGGRTADDVVFSPDGRTLVVTVADELRLFDVGDPQHPRSLGAPLRDHYASTGDARPGMQLATFSADGNRILAVTDGVIVWDLTDREHPRELGRTHTDDEPDVGAFGLAVDRTGHTAATSFGNELQVWDLTDPAQPKRLSVPGGLSVGALTQLRLSPDGNTLAVQTGSSASLVSLWERTPDGFRLHGQPLLGHTEPISALLFLPDGHGLLSASHDGTVILWDLDAAELTPQLGPELPAAEVSNVAFSPVGSLLATTRPDSAVQLLNVTDPGRAQPIGPPLPAHQTGAQNSFAFSADGRLLAVASSDNTLTLWDLTDAEHPRTLGQPIALGPPPAPDMVGEAGSDEIVVSPDGRTLVCALEAGVQQWDITDREHPRPIGKPFGTTPHTDLQRGLSFSPDGTRLAVGRTDGLTIWDSTDRDHPRPLAEGLQVGEDAVFLPDGTTVLTLSHGVSSTEEPVTMWDVRDPARPRLLGRPFGAAQSLGLSRDGRTLAAISQAADIPTVLWDLTDRTRPRPLGEPLAGDVNSVSFSPEDRTIAISSFEKPTTLRDISRLAELHRDPVGQACARAGGPLPPAEWSIYTSGLDYQDTCAR